MKRFFPGDEGGSDDGERIEPQPPKTKSRFGPTLSRNDPPARQTRESNRSESGAPPGSEPSPSGWKGSDKVEGSTRRSDAIHPADSELPSPVQRDDIVVEDKRADEDVVQSGRSVPIGDEVYAILGQVGEGTFGKVYKAQNTLSRVNVALKRIRMESERDGFPVTAMREIKLLQSLRHDNVVRLYEMMVSDGGRQCSHL